MVYGSETETETEAEATPQKTMEMKKILSFLVFFFMVVKMQVDCYSVARMPRGFRASPGGDNQFQPILLSQNSRFALGFERAGQNHFLLSVVCGADLSSGIGNATIATVWTASRNNPVRTQSEFLQDVDGSLVLREYDQGKPIWEIPIANNGVLTILNSGNLQLNQSGLALWQSFDHPTDTLLEGQNFTASMTLIAASSPSNESEGDYRFQMEDDGMSLRWRSDQVYWRRLAMQEKALIVPGKGKIYARLESEGYIAMYQTESQLVDVFPLNTYHQNTTFRRLKIESDGNLRSYYWSARLSNWQIDLVAVENNCQLPSFCGPRGLCTVDSQCTCLSPDYQNQSCLPGGGSANFCAQREVGVGRIAGIDVPFSRYLNFTAVDSENECRDLCAGKCSCAAAVFYGNSKRCYEVASPLQTLAEVAADDRVGFVKYVNETSNGGGGGGGAERKRFRVLRWVAVVVGGAAVAGGSVFVIWRRRFWYKGEGVESDVSLQMCEKFMGGLPYKNLAKQSSML